MKRFLLLLGFAFILPASAYAANERAVMVRVGPIYISPDASSAKLGDTQRGREVVILETSRDWVHVMADVTAERSVTGWILDKGIIRTATPNGDKILYGEAVDSEDEASRRRGRRGAAEDAMRLYYRVYEYFPSSPLAGEALYRAADIRWQIDKSEIMSKPSAREREAFLRGEINDEWMKLVMKKYPGTKWAGLAAFHLIDNKLCGDWQGASKCPEKESDIYEKYAQEYADSPSAPEALYRAAWRQSALIEIYKTENKNDKSKQAEQRAASLSQRIIDKYPQSDWAPRAIRLLYLVQQGIPTWGSEVQ
jgi:hypothetical protein